MNNLIDLRSDTVTKPTPAMLEAMMQATVGDDVYGEDESVNTLQSYAAALFGMEAALFCPSGTMTNQIAIKVHTKPGDELICGDNSHVYKYEGGGIAFNSGVQTKIVQGNRGLITANQIESAINADDVHFAHTSLVCLENTNNRGGGSVYSMETMKDIQKLCQLRGLNLHLDGARLFNAMGVAGYKASDIGNTFDSISICLSKGLGAPVGSLLLGNHTFIQQAKRVRKVFGGGMRQAGYLAAAGLFALQNNINRLSLDHQKAAETGNVLASLPWIKSVMPVETNIVIAQLHSVDETERLVQHLKQHQILCGRISPDQVRVVFHLDITDSQVEFLFAALKGFA